MNRESKKILVTGATGLVGSRVLPRLVAAGFDCYALVRRPKDLPDGATAVEGDLLDAETLTGSVGGFSAIIHLAAVFRSPDMDLIWKSNLDGTKNLIEAVKAQSPDARFIMAGTAHVYDAYGNHPGREDDAIHPEHAYPASKAAAELELSQSGLNWSVLRFPFVYGDGDGHLEDLPKHVIPAKWHPATRMSTIHHLDIFRALQMALEGTMDGRRVNLCDDAPISIYELLRMVGVEMEPSAEPLVNPWYLQVDSSVARSLGFQPAVRTVYQAVREGLL